jgi:hypothetical protein
VRVLLKLRLQWRLLDRVLQVWLLPPLPLLLPPLPLLLLPLPLLLLLRLAPFPPLVLLVLMPLGLG